MLLDPQKNLSDINHQISIETGNFDEIESKKIEENLKILVFQILI